MTWKVGESGTDLEEGRLGPKRGLSDQGRRMGKEGTYKKTTVKSFPALPFDGVVRSAALCCVGTAT